MTEGPETTTTSVKDVDNGNEKGSVRVITIGLWVIGECYTYPGPPRPLFVPSDEEDGTETRTPRRYTFGVGRSLSHSLTVYPRLSLRTPT